MKFNKISSILIKKRKLLLIFILVLIVFAAVGYSNYESRLFKDRVSPTPTATPNLLSGWYVYTSLKYNFSFKYPANFGGQGSISGPTNGTVESLRSFIDPSTVHQGTNDYFDGFSVYVVTKLGTTSFDKYINKEVLAMNKAKFESMRNPIKTQIAGGVSLSSKDGKQAYYYLPNSDNSQIVILAYLAANSSFKQVFDQVLASFKFISTADTKIGECIAKTNCTGSTPCMANPASVFCICMGGKERIVNGANGQSGVCSIDGKDHDEWEYFRSFLPTQ